MAEAGAIRRRLAHLALVCVVTLTPAWAMEITDDRGVNVKFDRVPQRIVSLLPSLTETVCELGHCARLVGVDRYSNFPDLVRMLPKVGGGIDPNIEAIVALKPDLVLMASSSRGAERLQSLGIKLVALEPKTHADVQRVLTQVGQLLGEPPDSGSARVWRNIEVGLVAVAQSLPSKISNTRVYFEVNNGPYAASEASFLGQTLTKMGVQNIVPASLGPFPKVNPEFVVRANPDVIMVGERSATLASLAQRPGWRSIRAIQARHVCVFSPDQSDTMVRPGPRMAEGARAMAQCLLALPP